MFEHEYFEYLAGYALDALTPAEKARLEEHLKSGCEICEPELIILNATVSRFAQGNEQVQLATGLKEKVHARLDKEGLLEAQDSTVHAIPIRRTGVYWLAVAALLAAAITAFLYWNTNRELKRQSVTLAQKEEHISQLEKMLSKKDAEISWLRDPGVQLALLTGLANASQARGKMIWHPTEHKGIFYVESLPPLAADKSYQLWAIGAEGPVSAGVFETDRRGAAVLTIQPIQGKLDGPPQFAVTIEPYGGVSKPTTTPILLGKPL
ncbi:MAG TPA: anti-sigma factor [Acidobacteriota bacterium]|nr:anti-sigma factor [Acidobacteriota bacterium]